MLHQKLKIYQTEDIYPFHMPGHKRQKLDFYNPYEIDITEIEGFDNLHHATEVLFDDQKKVAKLYGSMESFYLINGSTCGILSAISAVVKRNGTILVARNCHKSVYHALFLRQLQAVYVYPKVTKIGIQGQVLAEDIEQQIVQNKNIQAVFITSPTYDGIVSDVKKIANVVHKYGLPLIVDSAHGAHFGFSKAFPQNAISQGADIVIESVHKTLPAFTQTALLHVCSQRISVESIRKYLSIYQTSSPSYVLMAGIDKCMDFLIEKGNEYFQKFEKNLSDFYEHTKSFKHLKVVTKQDFSKQEIYDFDMSKILIFSKRKEISGANLQEVLLKKYGLQMEMASGNYVLALTSLMDTKEGFQRLECALCDLDNIIETSVICMKKEYNKNNFFSKEMTEWICTDKDRNGILQNLENKKTNVSELEVAISNIYTPQQAYMEIYEAEELEKTVVSFENAVGKINGEYLYLYPPGIPMIVPGEVILEKLIQDIKMCQALGLEVEGLYDVNHMKIVLY